ncbi:MAG: site-specific integrase [Thermodesulfobacteriota bacterium]|nr:site-specific integrase [Thermodesulfobacteriota bacterium]
MDTQTIAPISDFDPGIFAIEAIENDPNLQTSTKHQYKKALQNYLDAGHDLLDPSDLKAYAKTVGSSTRSFLSAAITRLANETEQLAKSGATPENIDTVTAAVYRAQSLKEAIKTKQTEGQKAHTWLSQKQVADLLAACYLRKSGNPEPAIVFQRDRLAIGLLVAAGLRRKEAVDLCFKDVKLQPIGDKIRTVIQVRGKGAKDRVVPISDDLANAIDDWSTVLSVGEQEHILRSLGRNKKPGESMSTTAIYNLVQKRGGLIGKPDLQPHDLRRTYAQLGYEAGIPIAQISILLGHANIKTTQRYLNLELDLESTISDFIPFGPNV